MRYSEQFEHENNDILDASQDINSCSKTTKNKKRKKSRIFVFFIVFLCILLSLCVGLYSYVFLTINKVEHQPFELEKEELNITTSQYADIKNIALLGIDSRKDNTSGRSDAIIILTIDKTNKKIKLTSIARDSYVEIEGRSKDKLTHAYAFGKSPLAVKTLNKNFDLEITDYITVNFFEFKRIIDYIGGVYVDVDKREMEELNKNVIPTTDSSSNDYALITHTGIQKLSGEQALNYARIRKIDSDIMRGNRQREVLMSMFNQVKDLSITKLPTVAEMILGECQTSLSASDIISLGTWGLTAKPQIEDISIPNENVKSSGKIIGGVWYSIYDTEVAKQEIKDFILETGEYANP